jgi:adenylylsulfate kinase-like enzyme
LYKKARKGEMKDFTGIPFPYEPPLNPETSLKTGEEGVATCVEKILEFLKRSNFFQKQRRVNGQL